MHLRALSTLVIATATLTTSCGGNGDSKPAVVSPAPAIERAFPAKAELHALIKARVDAKRASGLVVGVREADGTHTIVAYGDAGPGATWPQKRF